MTQEHDLSGRIAAELLLRVSRAALGDGFVEALTSAQWMALRYFARANRFSRTVSAFADFHATTRGTASQTVQGLIKHGYLTRTRSDRDGRSAHIDLTDKAKAILAHDPFEAVVMAADALPVRSRSQLVRALAHMLSHVVRQRGRATFGVCGSCAHLQSDACCRSDLSPYQCRLLNEPLSAEETEQICVSFEPVRTVRARASVQGS